MWLTLAVGAWPEPAARLWTGRQSHPGLQFSPLRNGRKEEPTSRSRSAPHAPRRRAPGETGVPRRDGRGCGGDARGGRKWAPPWACGRTAALQRVAREPSGDPPNATARGPGRRGPPPRGPHSAEVPAPAEADTEGRQLWELAEPPSGPAFPTGGRGEGRGLRAQLCPPRIPRLPSPVRNALPPGRLPGLPSPPPLPVDLEPTQYTVKSSEPVLWVCAPSPKAGPQEKWDGASGYLWWG